MAGEAHQRVTDLPRWFFCDLDGTLIGRGETLSDANRRWLQNLRAGGWRVVPATGRNWKTLHEALPPDAPADFAIYSTGAGVVNWQCQNEVHGTQLSRGLIEYGRRILLDSGVDFTLHCNWPDNHTFVYHAATPEAECRSDFYGRLRHNAGGTPLTAEFAADRATQFLVILPPDGAAHAAEIAAKFDERFSVVRATSPADGKSIWMEIFAAGVNKAAAARRLTAHYGGGETFAVGNDYNDLALLEWADHALVMPDAPAELLKRFPVVDADCAHLMEKVAEMPGWKALRH